jgi:hypothetical protein
MKFYAACNYYASESSLGFSNTWYVRVFDSRKARDEYVENARDLATRAITRKEVPGFTVEHPKPFSGEYIGIIEYGEHDRERHEIPGCIGYIDVVNPYDSNCWWKDEPARFYS